MADEKKFGPLWGSFIVRRARKAGMHMEQQGKPRQERMDFLATAQRIADFASRHCQGKKLTIQELVHETRHLSFRMPPDEAIQIILES